MNYLSWFELKRVFSFIRFDSVFSGVYMWSNRVTGFIFVFYFYILPVWTRQIE